MYRRPERRTRPLTAHEQSNYDFNVALAKARAPHAHAAVYDPTYECLHCSICEELVEEPAERH